MMRALRISYGLVGVLLAVSVSLLVAGCGGGSGDRFSGAPTVPAGFEVAKGTLASFAHPATWNATTSPFNTVRIITARAPKRAGSAAVGAELTQDPKLEDSFDLLVDGRRTARSKSGKDRTEKREDVKVSGSKRAVLYRGQVTFGTTRYDSFDLSVLTADGGAVFFSAIVPADGDVDADAILDSLRLNGA